MSATPALQDALRTQLAVLCPTALVCIGDPDWIQDDIVSIGDASSSEEPAGIAPGLMWEVIDVTVVVTCFRGGRDQTVPRAAAYTVLSSLRTYLRATDRTIGGTVMGNGGVTRHELRMGSNTEGVAAEMTLTVRAYAEVS